MHAEEAQCARLVRLDHLAALMRRGGGRAADVGVQLAKGARSGDVVLDSRVAEGPQDRDPDRQDQQQR